MNKNMGLALFARSSEIKFWTLSKAARTIHDDFEYFGLKITKAERRQTLHKSIHHHRNLAKVEIQDLEICNATTSKRAECASPVVFHFCGGSMPHKELIPACSQAFLHVYAKEEFTCRTSHKYIF
jgi:hypothetical protein